MFTDHSYGIIPLQRHEGSWMLFLVQHNTGNWWSFPKGHADDGEDPKQAAERELYEETGLSVVSYLDLPSLEENYHFLKNGNNVAKTVTYFLAEVSGEPKLQPEEIVDGKWVLLSQAHEHVTFDEARRLCQDLQNIL